MNYKYSCVINNLGTYIEFILLLLTNDTNGNEKWMPQCYTLKDGEQLIDTLPPTSMVKPKWNFNNLEWQETATAEEIAEAEKNKPLIVEPQPTAEQLAILDLTEQTVDNDYRISVLELGL